MHSMHSNAHLIDREDLTDDLCIVRIQPDTGDIPTFEPGQFATLGLPRETSTTRPAHDLREHMSARLADHDIPETTAPHRAASHSLIRRAYSIASSPVSRDYIELCLTLVREGHFTPRFWSLRPGSPIWLDPSIRGKFTLAKVPPEADLVMVATGTGIAPYMSMVRTYLGRHHWRRLAVLHGARLVADLAYRAELESITAGDSTIVYLPTVTREPSASSWRGARGRVTALLDPSTFADLVGWPLDPRRAHVMLCGNPGMIEDAAKLLTNTGFTSKSSEANGNLHFERYW